MVLIKNIYRSDSSSYLSTQVLSHNPEKKITCLIDFSIPNNIKHSVYNNIISKFNYSLYNNDSLTNMLIISKLKFFSKYINSFITHHVPLYIYYQPYNAYGLSQGIFDSQLEHGKKIQLSSKGKPFNFQFSVVYNKQQISNIWDTSLYTSKYDAVLNIGKNSNIWSTYNHLYIDRDKMMFSENELSNPYILNENKFKIKCFQNDRILNYKLFENIKTSNETLLNLILESACISLKSLRLKESHLGLSESKEYNYNIIINPNLKFNYLPLDLYFYLYEQETEISNFQITKKVKKKSSNNFITLEFNNFQRSSITFRPSYGLDFVLDNQNQNDIIIGASMFSYFSTIKYNNINSEYTFWISDITSNNNYMVIILNFIFIFETFLFYRWYLTSNMAISNYIVFHILMKKSQFYYNNSQVFAEIIAIILAIFTLILSIYSFINTSNIPIYVIVSFSFQSFLILYLIAITIVFIVNSKDHLKSIFRRKNDDDNKNNKNIVLYMKQLDKILPLKNSSLYLPKFLPKHKTPVVDSTKIPKNQYKSKLQLIIEKAVLKLYSLTTTEVSNQFILQCIGRNLIHMSLILLTMVNTITMLIDDRLTRAILTFLSMLIIYYLTYYILILLYALIIFYNEFKNYRIAWISLEIVSILILLILIPYVSFTYVFNFLDSVNSNHSTLIVGLSSIILILLTSSVSSKTILNDVERWKSILENKSKLKIEGVELSKEV